MCYEKLKIYSSKRDVIYLLLYLFILGYPLTSSTQDLTREKYSSTIDRRDKKKSLDPEDKKRRIAVLSQYLAISEEDAENRIDSGNVPSDISEFHGYIGGIISAQRTLNMTPEEYRIYQDNLVIKGTGQIPAGSHLKKCKDCSKIISSRAKTCPSCGAPQEEKKKGWFEW